MNDGPVYMYIGVSSSGSPPPPLCASTALPVTPIGCAVCTVTITSCMETTIEPSPRSVHREPFRAAAAPVPGSKANGMQKAEFGSAGSGTHSRFWTGSSATCRQLRPRSVDAKTASVLPRF